MYKNILVPVVFDHEPSAEQALEVAHSLLDDGGKLSLLHVVEDIPAYASTLVPEDVWNNTTVSAAKDLKDLAASNAKGADTAVITGHPSRAILDYGDEIDADCIIISSHKPGLEDYFLGSTAARVVRHAKCAVHILR